MWFLEELHEILCDLPLHRYSNLLIHANLGLSGVCGTDPLNPHGVFLDALQNKVGNCSNFFIPAFTYSFANRETFRPYSDSGLKAMGLVSQEAWARGYSRTFDPMFSLLGFGETIHEFISKPAVNSSHGDGSTFAKLVDANTGLILVNVGCATTLIHEFEYRFSVSYRFLKEFVGFCQEKPEESAQFMRWKAFVNNRNIPNSEADFSVLNRDLFSEPNTKRIKLGRGYLVHLDTDFLQAYLKTKLENNPWYLTRRGQLSGSWEND